MELDAIRAFALSLPAANEEPHFELTSFRVKGKVFATAPRNGACLNVFVDEDIRAPLIAVSPDTYLPLHWGSGWWG